MEHAKCARARARTHARTHFGRERMCSDVCLMYMWCVRACVFCRCDAVRSRCSMATSFAGVSPGATAGPDDVHTDLSGVWGGVVQRCYPRFCVCVSTQSFRIACVRRQRRRESALGLFVFTRARRASSSRQRHTKRDLGHRHHPPFSAGRAHPSVCVYMR